ncbi:MAG: hypothetical protein BroJett018_34680 [Chloroflexota bacterium]|nr:MAG: hypothetical protein BroJett018_34680 [Chloroflexota bacterium]
MTEGSVRRRLRVNSQAIVENSPKGDWLIQGRWPSLVGFSRVDKDSRRLESLAPKPPSLKTVGL